MKSTIKNALLFVCLFTLGSQFTFSQKKDKHKIKRQTSISINHQGKDTDVSQGFWNLEDGDHGVMLQLASSKGASYSFKRDSFYISFHPSTEELSIINRASSNFSVERAAGTLNCSEQGAFTFTINQDFQAFLNKEGIENGTSYDFMKLFLGAVDKTYVTGIKNEGYQPTLKQLGKMGILGIDLKYVSSIAKTHYKGLELNMLTKFYIHGVEKSYIDELASLGYSDLDPNMLKKFAIHDISTKYIKNLSDLGYADMDSNMIKKFAIHNIETDYIKGLNVLGYKNLEPNDIKKLAIHEVSLDYIKSLKSLDIHRPTISEIKKAKIHDVSANFIKRANKAGHNSKNLSDYVKLKIHGI